MSTYLKVSLLIIAFFLLRPSALGQQLTTYGLVLILIALAIHIIEIVKWKIVTITKKNYLVLIMSLLLWVYLFVHAWIMGSNNMDFVIKASTANVVVIFSCAIMLSEKKLNFLFFRWLIILLSIFSASYLITVFLAQFISYDKLLLFNIPIKGYEDTQSGNIYFPFTSLYGFYGVGNIRLPRSLGLFRESGIFQSFLIWGFFNLKQFGLNKNLFKFLLLTGIISTFSTSGIAIFFAVFAIKQFFDKKRLRSMVLIIFGFIVFMYTPYIGFLAKSSDAHSASVTIRGSATIEGLKKLLENPIGTGLYNSDSFDIYNSGINLLATSYTIGIIGLLLVILVYLLPLFNYQNKKNYIIGITPFFITLLISQPILDAPDVYLILLASYTTNELVIVNRKKYIEIE